MSSINPILTYLSSSELNRCKKNGLNVLESRKLWFDVLSYTWLTRKLRRKLGHLMQLDLLPVTYSPTVGIFTIGSDGFWPICDAEFSKRIATKLMAAEDEAIMKGMGK